jgi:hypothetical protein
MAADILTYSPDEVALVFGGYRVRGWNRISIQRNTEFVKQIRGIRGKHAKEVSRDTSCTLLLTIPQSTEVNTILSKVLELEQTSKGKVRLEIMLKDEAGGSVFTSVECYIGGWPNVTYGAELNDVEWKFLCDSSEWQMKGNEANKNAITDMISGALGSAVNSIGNLF